MDSQMTAQEIIEGADSAPTQKWADELIQSIDDRIQQVLDIDLDLDILPATEELLGGMSFPYGREIVEALIRNARAIKAATYWNATQPSDTAAVEQRWRGLKADWRGEAHAGWTVEQVKLLVAHTQRTGGCRAITREDIP